MKNVFRVTLFIGFVFLLNSCDKCLQCTFSYTVTKTEFTPQGEVTYIDTVENQALPNESGTLESKVCGDEDEVEALRTRYQNGNSDGQYNNYEYECIDQ